MKPSIGHMRERVTLLTPARKKDDMGGYTVSWARKGTLWAHIAPQTNTSAMEDKKGWKKAFYKIRLRLGHKLEPTMRLKWGEKLLKITSEPIPVNNALEFSAIEIKQRSGDDE